MSEPLQVPLRAESKLQLPWLTRMARRLGRPRLRTFAYEDQQSLQSLREGLEEYYASGPELLPPENVSEDVRLGLRAHDATHVVFGCDTSVRGEVTLARWSLLGASDAIPIYLRGLREKETRFLFADFFRKIRPLSLLLAALDGSRALLRSFRMRKRWPTLDWESYADRTLAEIRTEFGIRVV